MPPKPQSPTSSRKSTLAARSKNTLKASPKTSNKLKAAPKAKASNKVLVSADDQHRQKVAAYVGQIFSQPWIQELMGQLAQRQQKSIQHAKEIRELSVTSPSIWPLHAIPMPVCIESAKGSRLRDLDGNEYVDFHMGFGCQSVHGHNPEPVVKYVQNILGRGTGNGYYSAFELEHARLIKEFVPHRERLAFANSGSDVTTAAIRLCRAHTGRQLVVKFEGSINGQYDLVSYNSSPFYHGYPLMPFPPKSAKDGVQLTTFLPGSQKLGKEDMLILSFNDPVSLEIIRKRKNEIACVLTEPIPLSFPFPDKAIPFIRELNETCRKSNVPLILDEVHSGFRYGPSGVTGFFNLDPDLVTYGKSISALGIPLSAVGGRADIMNLATTTGASIMDYGRRIFMITSHVGNHLALAASYASLNLLKEKGQGFYDRTRHKATYFKAKLAQICQQEGISLKLLGFGDFMGMLAFVEDKEVNNMRELSSLVNPLATAVLVLMLRRRGIFFFSAPFFYLGDGHSEQDLDTLLTAITDSVREMKRHGFDFKRPTF